MRFFSLTTTCLLVVFNLASAQNMVAPPLPDGLPNPSVGQIEGIQQRAQGTLPNISPPPRISSDGITNLQLWAFTELFEVAFFDSLLRNITTNVPGYESPDIRWRNFVTQSLVALLAQAEIQAITANNILRHFNLQPIQPCRYHFPATNLRSALAVINVIIELSLGSFQDMTDRFAKGGDFFLARFITSVTAQKGEQLGSIRILQHRIPSELPFLTTGDVDLTYSAVQNFTVPGSCPSRDAIHLRTFHPLNILTEEILPGPQLIRFSWTPNPKCHFKQLWVTFINQQNKPIVEHMNIISSNNQTVIAEALFPYDKHLLNGLTIVAVTNKNGTFTNADDVSKATVFGPGVITVR